MAKKKTEELLKIEYGEEKGRGSITITNPLQFAHGKVYFETVYSPESMDSTVRLICKFKEECEEAYADEIVFYDGDKVLKTIRVKNFDAEKYKGDVDKMLKEVFHLYEPKQILYLLTAQNLNLRLVSRLRKYDDVKIEGSEIKEFQRALQALVDLVSDQQAYVQYVCQHDDSFESLYNAQKETKKQKKQAEKQEEKKQQAAERRERKARQEAEEKAQQRARVMIVIGVVLIIAGIYGLYKGFVICTAEESNFVTGLLVMGISFFLTIPIGLGIISNNKN